MEYATATTSAPPAPLLQAAIESTLITVLFAILGAALVGRPLRQWMEGERQRVVDREEQLRRAVARQQFSARLSQALSHAAAVRGLGEQVPVINDVVLPKLD